jgi:hypothetical protein
LFSGVETMVVPSRNGCGLTLAGREAAVFLEKRSRKVITAGAEGSE